MAYPYIIFGCGCNPRCVCNLCGIKAVDCRHAECQKCDKIAGHLGCMCGCQKGKERMSICLKQN